MLFRSLTKDASDWSFGAGLSDFTDRDKAIGLNIKTRLLSWVGDCFFDTRAGVDWVNRLGSKSQRQLLEQDLRRVILQSFGVTGITSFDTTLVGRSFSASFSVDTIYGQAYQDIVKVEI